MTHISAYFDPPTDCYLIRLEREGDNGREVLTDNGWVEHPRFSTDCPVTARIGHRDFKDFISSHADKPKDTSGLESHLSDLQMVVRHFCK
jgi:hypothetical protein